MKKSRGVSRRTLRRALLVAIAGLYLLSIPWYREAGSAPALWLGLPDWVVVAIACYAGVAVLNAAAWLLTDVPDVPQDGDGSPR